MDLRDFLPQPPWEGLPIPKILSSSEEPMCARCGLPPYLLFRETVPGIWELSRDDVGLWLDPSWKNGKICKYCRKELYEIRVFGSIQTRKWEERWRLLKKIDIMTVDELSDWYNELMGQLEIARANKGVLSNWAYKRSSSHRYVVEIRKRMTGSLYTALSRKLGDMYGWRPYFSEAYRQCDRHLLSYYVEEWKKLFEPPDWWLEEE